MKNDDFGNRMKHYEDLYTHKLIPFLPIYVRLDGKGFSKFTKGMRKPYDERMVFCMHETTKYLIEEFTATVGYTQSDEISLVWSNEEISSEMLFGGKTFKWISLLASTATSKFNALIKEKMPEYASKLPTFDCRILQFPNQTECTNMLLWRVQDATKNSISCAAQTVYSHKELMNKSGREKLKMLSDKGIIWDEYPISYKFGEFFRRKTYEIDGTTLMDIPEKFRPVGMVTRHRIESMDLFEFGSVYNREEVIFEDLPPRYQPYYDWEK